MDKSGTPKLIWLQIIHRHGDRSPFKVPPKDKYRDIKYWPEGFGNLNNRGRSRMFKLGQFIRRRYDHFITDNIREVYSRSSDAERCIESASAVLAGMYPPSERFKWNTDLPWIPAPVHTAPAEDDYLLNFDGKEIRQERDLERIKIQNSDAVKKMYEDSVKEREILEREHGYNFEKFTTFPAAYSTLLIEEEYGLELPPWYTNEFKKKLKDLAKLSFSLGSATLRLKQMEYGQLLEDMITRMKIARTQECRDGDKSDLQQPTNAPAWSMDRKVVHYSTHDWTITGLLDTFKIKVGGTPGFGASFFIELYVDVDENDVPIGEKYLKVFYLNDTETEAPVEQVLQDCELNSIGRLTWNNFQRGFRHLLPNQDIIDVEQ